MYVRRHDNSTTYQLICPVICAVSDFIYCKYDTIHMNKGSNETGNMHIYGTKTRVDTIDAGIHV